MRFRALPIAQDGCCITVALAEPGNLAAREAVTAALTETGSGQADGLLQVYLVQGDPALIDARLAELAQAGDDQQPGLPAASPLDITLWEPLQGCDGAIGSYAQQVAALLAAPLRPLDPLADGATWPDEADSGAPALAFLPCPGPTWPSCLEGSGAGSGPALWFVCRPRWPLRRLLLIVRGDPVDDAVLAWAARLARASGAAATALMVAPHIPAPRAAPVHDDISSLLLPNTTTGHKMQQAAQRLAAMQLGAVLHLRQGAPELVIREELASAPYDLLIAGVALHSTQAPWRLRPLLHKLVLDLPCPLLLTGNR